MFPAAFQKHPKRRIVLSPKFFFFNVGVANTLLNRPKLEPKTELFGKAFEHFLYQEIYAHSRYSDMNYPLAFWRTSTQKRDFLDRLWVGGIMA
jgi:predicted AAA+ superfamily ATPase